MRNGELSNWFICKEYIVGVSLGVEVRVPKEVIKERKSNSLVPKEAIHLF